MKLYIFVLIGIFLETARSQFLPFCFGGKTYNEDTGRCECNVTCTAPKRLNFHTCSCYCPF